MTKELGHAVVTPFQPFDFEAANKHYVEKVFSEPDMIVGARSRVGIISCCDARCSPDHFFQLQPNEAFIIRNGGGRTSSIDVLRTIASIEVLSDIKELKVIHHTDCGSLSCTDEWIRDMIRKNDPNAKGGPFPEGALRWAESMAFQPFNQREGESERDALERSVIEDVQFLRTHPLIKPTIPVTGWVYNQHNGAVEEVDCGVQKGIDRKSSGIVPLNVAKKIESSAQPVLTNGFSH